MEEENLTYLLGKGGTNICVSFNLLEYYGII